MGRVHRRRQGGQVRRRDASRLVQPRMPRAEPHPLGDLVGVEATIRKRGAWPGGQDDDMPPAGRHDDRAVRRARRPRARHTDGTSRSRCSLTGLQPDVLLKLDRGHRRYRLEVPVESGDTHPRKLCYFLDPEGPGVVLPDPPHSTSDVLQATVGQAELSDDVTLFPGDQPPEDLALDQRGTSGTAVFASGTWCCPACMSRSCRLPCTTGRGKDTLTTCRSGIRKICRDAGATWYSSLISSVVMSASAIR